MYDLGNIPYNSEFSFGAWNAINTCLRVQPHERVTLITDEQTLDIAASLYTEVQNVGAPCEVFIIEDYTPRPMKHMPEAILEGLQQSDVGIYTVQSQKGEIMSRRQVLNVVNERRLMYAHMVNISPRIMVEGMRADFQQVDALGKKLHALAMQTRTIVAKAKGGTEIEATFNPKYKWFKTSGIISREKWGNLPGGEVLTYPENVNGVYVIDGVIGDYLCEKYGDLQATPLTVEIENSRIAAVQCEREDLRDDFWQYTHTDDNSNRVGEFAIGINTAVKHIIGNMLQDEKIPGMHIAFGDPYGSHTGANWGSTTHIDVVGRNFDIWMDGEKVMEGGRFLI
jgi:leucyl aminopeptidase (aminopeptidase T)